MFIDPEGYTLLFDSMTCIFTIVLGRFGWVPFSVSKRLHSSLTSSASQFSARRNLSFFEKKARREKKRRFCGHQASSGSCLLTLFHVLSNRRILDEYPLPQGRVFRPAKVHAGQTRAPDGRVAAGGAFTCSRCIIPHLSILVAGKGSTRE